MRLTIPRSWGDMGRGSFHQNILLQWQCVKLPSSKKKKICHSQLQFYLKKKFSKIAREKFNQNYLHINFPVDSVKQRWIVMTLVCLNFNFCPDFKPIKLKFWSGQFTEKISGSLAWLSSLRFMFRWQDRNECFLAF